MGKIIILSGDGPEEYGSAYVNNEMAITRWLEQLDEVVGYAKNECDCPVHRLLSSKDREDCLVDGVFVKIAQSRQINDEEITHFHLGGEWVSIISIIDSLPYETPITGRMAIQAFVEGNTLENYDWQEDLTPATIEKVKQVTL